MSETVKVQATSLTISESSSSCRTAFLYQRIAALFEGFTSVPVAYRLPSITMASAFSLLACSFNQVTMLPLSNSVSRWLTKNLPYIIAAASSPSVAAFLKY